MFGDANSTKMSKRFHLTSNMDRVVLSILVPLLHCFVSTIIHGIHAGGKSGCPCRKMVNNIRKKYYSVSTVITLVNFPVKQVEHMHMVVSPTTLVSHSLSVAAIVVIKSQRN